MNSYTWFLWCIAHEPSFPTGRASQIMGNGWKWWFPTISYIKIWNHPIETTILKWMFQVPVLKLKIWIRPSHHGDGFFGGCLRWSTWTNDREFGTKYMDGFYPKMDGSGQMVHNISPTTRFPWNFTGICLTKPPFGENRSCEVAIIWPAGENNGTAYYKLHDLGVPLFSETPIYFFRQQTNSLKLTASSPLKIGLLTPQKETMLVFQPSRERTDGCF